ncbi:MAG: outer membrane beta-barrel protein [Bacteroidota bacterium]
MNKSRKFAPLIIIAVILIGLTNIARAQDEEDDPANARTFYAGVLAGTNFAQVDGDNFAGYRRIGLNIGGIGYVQVHKHVAFSWEILYSQKGSRSDMVKAATNDTAVLVVDYDIKLGYAEVPLMLNYFDKRKSHFGLGVSYSRLVSTVETATTDPSINLDLTKYPFRKDNFDILAGAQLHLWKGLFLNVRFQYSLLPVRTVSPPALSRSQRQYNNLWTVRLMYLFI